MKLLRYIPFLLLLTIFAASCSQLPQLSREPDDRASIRAQYLHSNPEGAFNSQIINGQVTKGMGVIEVLASWGLPNTRWLIQQTNAEHWTYLDRDPATDNITSYGLVFEDRVLARWIVEHNVTVHTDLPRGDVIGMPMEGKVLTLPRGAFVGDRGVQKKKP